MIGEGSTQPGRVAVAGDWHGNTRWACFMIEQAAAELAGEQVKILLHLGDFLPTFYYPRHTSGYSAEDRQRNVHRFLYTIQRMLDKHSMHLMFIDGNHEDWDVLNAARESWRHVVEPFHDMADEMPIPLRSSYSDAAAGSRIFWLPRGTRWTWQGREWLAFGGAASPNRVHLQEGWNWWLDEEITAEQVAKAAAQGPADVLLCHDVPSSVRIQYGEHPASWLQADLARGEEQRERLQMLAEAVKPSFLMHGHHHIPYCKGVNQPWGLMWSTGLAGDGVTLNMLTLSTTDLSWEVPGLEAGEEAVPVTETG